MKKYFAFRISIIIAILLVISIKPSAAQSVTATIPIGIGGYAIAVNPNTNRIYVLQTRMLGASNCLKTIDGSTNAIMNTLCFASPMGVVEIAQSLAVNPATNRIYFGTSNRLIVIDGVTNSVIAEIPNVIAVAVVVNPLTNRIYFKGEDNSWATIVDGFTNQIIGNLFPGDGQGGIGYLGINTSLNRLYVRAGGNNSIGVFDMGTNTYVDPVSQGFNAVGYGGWFDMDGEGSRAVFLKAGIDINTKTNRVYINDYVDYLSILVYEEQGGSQITSEPVDVIPLQGGQNNLVVNSNSNHIYAIGNDRDGTGLPAVWSVDGQTDTLTAVVPIGTRLDGERNDLSRGIALNAVTNRVYAANSFDGNLYVISGESSVTSTGSNIAVQASGATLTYNNVITAGTTLVEPISDPSQAGQIPGGFAVSESLGFEISTGATFLGPVTSCFDVPNVNTESEFLTLRVLHRELNTITGEYELIDRTTCHDFINRKICATTTSFSPFYLARVGNKVRSLLDQSKAYRAGSTIPIKVQMLDANDQNISTSNLPLTVRGLRRIGNSTSFAVADAGNSSPDSGFRYENGAGRYIYNLQTKGLSTGKYILSFYAGADHSFFYTVVLDLK
jgi:DNA-binding beta-propeller fold protein YncE